MERVDVAIVGAGPAGSSTAILLARLGYSVALIDKDRFPREKLCGDFINPANWRMLHNLGVAGNILACPHEKIGAFALTACSGERIEVPFPAGGAPVFGLGVRRFDLDRVLLEQARAEGAAVYEGSKITDLNRIDRGWFVDPGAGRSVAARVLVGADGRNSWIAQRLKLARPSNPSNSALGCQIRLRVRRYRYDSPPIANGMVEIHLFPGGYAGIANVGNGIATLGFAVKRRTFAECRNSVEKLIRLSFSQNPYLKKLVDDSEFAGEPRWTSPVYFPPRRSHGDGFLLVGDAARVNEPVSGEGIYFALKSGAIAACTIDQALRAGNVSAARLRSYKLQCRSAFRLRRVINVFIRQLVYRPALVSPIVRLSEQTKLIEKIVRTICQPEPWPAVP